MDAALSDKALQNLMILAAHALSGQTFTAEPEQMVEMWSDVVSVKNYLLSKQPAEEPVG